VPLNPHRRFTFPSSLWTRPEILIRFRLQSALYFPRKASRAAKRTCSLQSCSHISFSLLVRQPSQHTKKMRRTRTRVGTELG